MTAAPAGRTFALTACAMSAFAANSLLCRAALGTGRIDATSFTAVRVVSGALVLVALAWRRGGPSGSWASAGALFGYAMAFSLAYLRIAAGVGALLLFGAVQLTMLGHALASGQRLRPGEWIGFALAVAGLVVLTRPGLRAPDPMGVGLMVLAGAAWGVYTLRGRGSDPLRANAGNFARAALPALVAGVLAMALTGLHASRTGLLLAIFSGAVTSGLGYAIWYAALRGLTPTQAAIVQLSAPPLAAVGAVLFLGESFSVRLGLSAVMVLGGIALAVLVRDVT